MTCAALILAGGRSSRMGQDKALLPWDGIPLLVRVCNVAAACCDRVYAMTPWPERYRSLPLPACTWLLDPLAAGPLVALSQGLGAIAAEWVWLLACDMPLLDAELVRGWLAMLAAVPSECLAVVPQRDRQWEPLCGFYRTASKASLDAFLARGGRSFQGWLPELGAIAISLDAYAASTLWNCNTPEDMARS